MNESSYAVGNRVYNGGSSMPTAGTVDPMGYVERNMVSQTRSGLAAAALRRTGTQSTVPTTSPFAHASPYPEYRPTVQLPKVSPTGALSLPKHPIAALPFDAQGADDQATAYGNYTNNLQQLMQQSQNAERDYATGTRDVNQAEPGILRGLLNRAAGSGLAYSSGYADQYAGEQAAHARRLSDLGQTHNDALNSVLGKRASAQQDYNTTLAEIQRAIARRLAGKAGDLGLK